MKNLIAFLTFFFLLITFSACEKDKMLESPTTQNEIAPISQNKLDACGTPSPSFEGFEEIKNTIAKLESQGSNLRKASKTYAIPLYCNIITQFRNSDLTIQEVALSISRMNTTFKNTGIQFYIKRYKYIDDANVYNLISQPIADKSIGQGVAMRNNLPGGINIYFYPSPRGSGSSFTWSKRDWIDMSYNHTRARNVMAHELGHYFNLIHTHETGYGIELVDGSNSKTAGDLLTDTPADHGLRWSQYVDMKCQYSDTSTVRDPNGDMYSPDTKNIMSYTRLDCSESFSKQQKALAYTTMMEKRNYLISDIPYTGIGVFRPNSNKWYFRFNERTFTTRTLEGWGKDGDLPVGGDFNGDGLTDIAVYRPSTRDWYIDYGMDGSTDLKINNWGRSGDMPMTADFNQDGKIDIALYRPSTGYYYINTNLDNITDQTISPMRITYDFYNYVNLKSGYGLVGDFFEDGFVSRCVFDDKNGDWYFDEDMKNGSRTDKIIRGWGKGGDIPIVGDFDNDGKADISRYSPLTSTWFFDYNLDGKTDHIINGWGQGEDLPFSYIYPNSNNHN